MVGWGHWFTLANIILAMLIGLFYIVQAGWPDTLLANLFTLVYWFGHFGFLLFAGFVIFIFPLSFVIPYPKLYRALAAIVAAFGLSMILMDTRFYSDFGFHINVFLLELVTNDKGDKGSWFTALLAITFTGLLIIELFIANRLAKWRESRRRRRHGRRIAAFYIVCFFAGHFSFAAADALGYAPITRLQHIFPISYPMTAKTALSKLGWSDPNKHYQANNDEPPLTTDTGFHYPLHSLSPQTPDQQPNVVLISVAGLRGDMLNPVNMPHLYKLAQDGLSSLHHFASSNDEDTSLFGLLYSIPATYWDPAVYSRTAPILTQVLKQVGYHFNYFSAENQLGTEQRQSLYKQFDKITLGPRTANTALADQQIIQQWQQQQAQAQPPQFSLLQLESLSRFSTPPDFPNTFQPDFHGVLVLNTDSPEDAELIRNRYRNSVRYIDQLVANVAKAAGPDTVVIVTGEYGEPLGETAPPHWGHDTNYSTSQTQVPLVMFGPGVPQRRLTTPTIHYDIVPTLFHILGLQLADTTLYSSGLDLTNHRPRRDWMVLGDRKVFAIRESDRLTEIRRFGDYGIYDLDYMPLNNARLHVQVMFAAMHEIQRFLQED